MSTIKIYGQSGPSGGLPLRKLSGAQLISLATTSTAASTALKPGLSMISVIADTPCAFSISGSTATAFRIPAADQYFDFEVPGGVTFFASTSTG
jgi:hypothetical protein